MIPQLIAILVLSLCSLLIMFAFALRRRLQSMPVPTPEPLPSVDPLELVARFKFFQGKNLETFKELLEENRYQDIQNLIAQRFHAQGKANPERQAEEVSRRLFSSPAFPPVPHNHSA